MVTREWALIAFTILAQMSVGSFLVLGVVHYFASHKSGMANADQLSDRALIAIGPVMCLALIVSLIHLGNPLNAYRAIANIGSSWLSREIFFGVMFTAAGGLFAIMQWRKISSSSIRNLIAFAAMVLGIALVDSMANVYRLPAQPAWDSVTTPIAFFVTTFLLGALGIGAAFVANYAYIQRKNPGCASDICVLLRDSLRWIGLAAVILLGVELVVAPVQIASLAANGNAAAGASAMMLSSDYGLVLALRFILVFVGAGVLGLFVYQNALTPGHENVLGNLAYAAFLLVFISELMGRFLFYAAHVRIGI